MTGRDDLAEFITAYRTPFHILVGATFEFGAGDAVPEGELDVVIRVTARAGT